MLCFIIRKKRHFREATVRQRVPLPPDPNIETCIKHFKLNIKNSIRKLCYTREDPVHTFEKGRYVLAIITTYHYQDAGKAIQILREKYVKPHYHLFMIVFDGEPNDTSSCVLQPGDVIISTKLNPNLLPTSGIHLYLPYFLWYLYFLTEGRQMKLVKSPSWQPPRKEKFCVFAYSNCDEKFQGVKARHDFFSLLQRLSGNRVESIGQCLKNTVATTTYFMDNITVFAPYKFAIVFENESILGYTSEKLVNAMLAGCIPIYFGDPNVGMHFNTKSFVNVSHFPSLEACAQFVLAIDTNKELEDRILREPWLTENTTCKMDAAVRTFHQQLRHAIPFQLFLDEEPKLVLQTFADGQVFKTNLLVEEAKRSNYFHSIFAAGLEDLNVEFLNKHRDFILKHKRGFGYWLWKPQIILQRLQNMPENDILMYVDAGCIIQGGSPHIIRDYMDRTKTVLAFQIPFYTADWTKMDLYSSFETLNLSTILTTKSVMAGIILFRNNISTRQFVQQWKELCENYHNIDDSPSLAVNLPGFKEHRHDQAVFNLMCKMYNVPECLDYALDVKVKAFSNGDVVPIVVAGRRAPK